MRKTVRFFVVFILVLLPAVSFAGERFDGKWRTTMTCPPKGNTEGYTWKLSGEVTAGNFHAERGTADQPGYLVITGPIKVDGSAKHSANGIVVSRKYARGVFTHGGEEYSYNIKAQFKETEGTGTRDEGMGIVGRPCTFEFVKQ